MVVLFGFVRFRPERIHVGIVNEAGTEGKKICNQLAQLSILTVSIGQKEEQMRALKKGELDLILVIPPLLSPGRSLETWTSVAKPQEAQVGVLLIQQTLDHIALEKSGAPRPMTLKIHRMESRKLDYMDFLIPGMLAMSIMQTGIFSVAFGFVDLKKRGVLRRLRVTPMNPNDFIFAQVLTRLIVLLLDVTILVSTGMFFFDLNFEGNPFLIFLLGILGAVVFLAMGFAVAGISRSEDQVAPLANVITLPMMLLSGIFFNRTNLPRVIYRISSFFPLTFLADGIRSVAIDAAGISSIGGELIGLFIWAVVSCLLAIKLFRWE